MTQRTFGMSLLVVVLLVLGWVAGAAMNERPVLRSAHSEPARGMPPETVAVTDQGKLYHDPSCPLIHGPARLESGREALVGGFTPCTRCLPAE